MNIQIKHRHTCDVIYECEAASIREAVERAVRSGANLENASLDGANLKGAKLYKNSHAVFLELVRREAIETFTDGEWAIIGTISLHRPCWPAIKTRWGKSAIRKLT